MSSKMKWFWVALVLSLALDQGTKIWARHDLKPRGANIEVIPGYFELEYAENTSSAFSMLPHGAATRWALGAFALVALGVVAVYLNKAKPTEGRIGAELGLLAGGAVGNMIDRVGLGYVTDFVLWRVGPHRWPNFNVADAVLLVGIVGLLLDWKPEKESKKASKAA